MSLIWNTPLGTLGTFNERTQVNVPLSTSSSSTVSYSIISGSIPVGLQLSNGSIFGVPVEIKNTTQYKFVIRANNGSEILDRTFSITIEGPDAPVWQTPEGYLPLGFNNAYFVLDDTYVDFKLEAYDTDAIAGDTLFYYIGNNAGELPPGLTLTSDGRIQGFVAAVPKLELNQSTGNFDTSGYDFIPFDLGEVSSTGYDTFTYDNTTFDYQEPIKPFRQISRYYSFTVTVTDGETETKRNFRIYVVDEQFLRADNAIVKADDNVFRADNNHLRNPLWITPANLGRRRANNYTTIYLDVYNPITLAQNIVYFLDEKNTDGTNSVLPPGLQLDSISGEIVGKIPYQPRISVNYKFTIRAVSFEQTTLATKYTVAGSWDNNTIYNVGDVVKWIDPAIYNDSSIRSGIGESLYICLAEHKNKLPSNIGFWTEGATSTVRTFTVDVIGDIESGISWKSVSNLGSLKPNEVSELFVEAESLSYSGSVVYTLTSGELPPGLQLLSNGLIIGKVNQIGSQTIDGLTRFYDGGPSSSAFGITFDQGRTTFDKVYKFTIKAKDPSNFSEFDKQFSIKIIGETTKQFTNLYLRALQPLNKRNSWYDFITDSTIFDPKILYRVGDPNFATQSTVQMLLFAGLEKGDAVELVQAMSRNHYRKQIKFGSLAKAQGKDPITQEVKYEVIYVNVIDDLEKNNESISSIVNLPDYISSPVLTNQNNITVDSGGTNNLNWNYRVSDRDLQQIFPNSFKNMRNRLKEIGDRDRSYLPLWMRSIQPGDPVELGYTTALVLCYVKPGYADEIMVKIKARNFDFKLLDFEADRYVVDFLNANIGDQYFLFPQTDIKNRLISSTANQ
jgi:hypothetical protein